MVIMIMGIHITAIMDILIIVPLVGLANIIVSLAKVMSGTNMGFADTLSLASISTTAAKIKIGTLRQEGIL